ncbi:MAG TPA: hypothetical protein VFQ77_14125, partial [Pseudonocardiaceae bacterium]|nr:hypothetical protein [Pseudonocardiaceae bacterium]
MQVPRSRAVAALLAALGLTTLLGTVPGPAQAPTPPPPPISTPDTSGCPNRISPPPPVDLSEVPAPG